MEESRRMQTPSSSITGFILVRTLYMSYSSCYDRTELIVSEFLCMAWVPFLAILQFMTELRGFKIHRKTQPSLIQVPIRGLVVASELYCVTLTAFSLNYFGFCLHFGSVRLPRNSSLWTNARTTRPNSLGSMKGRLILVLETSQ